MDQPRNVVRRVRCQRPESQAQHEEPMTNSSFKGIGASGQADLAQLSAERI